MQRRQELTFIGRNLVCFFSAPVVGDCGAQLIYDDVQTKIKYKAEKAGIELIIA